MGLNRLLQGPFSGHQRSPWLCQGAATQPHRPACVVAPAARPRQRLPVWLMPSHSCRLPPQGSPLNPLSKSPSQFRAKFTVGGGMCTCTPAPQGGTHLKHCLACLSAGVPSCPCLCAGMSRQPPGSLGTTHWASVHQSRNSSGGLAPSKPRATGNLRGRSSGQFGTPKRCRGVTAAQAPRLSKCERWSEV